jgi:hypothetical protein
VPAVPAAVVITAVVVITVAGIVVVVVAALPAAAVAVVVIQAGAIVGLPLDPDVTVIARLRAEVPIAIAAVIVSGIVPGRHRARRG